MLYRILPFLVHVFNIVIFCICRAENIYYYYLIITLMNTSLYTRRTQTVLDTFVTILPQATPISYKTVLFKA